MSANRLLPVLVLVSGFCGISYEILYAKLLGNLLGSRFTISASVLLTFLLGIGLGTLYAHRFVRRLWLIEGCIGLYAALMVVSQGWIDRILYSVIPAVGTNLAACAGVSILLLVLPAFLVGCSLPLFAAYLGSLRRDRVFSTTYAIYNVGAALTALGLEFVLLRVVGLRAATLGLAVLNVAVAASLLFLVRTTPLIPNPRSDRLRFSGRDLSALGLASVASAIFQLLMIKLAESILGPFNETFSLVLASVLIGLALGSVAVGRLGLSFPGALLVGMVGLAALLGFHSDLAGAYASLYPGLVQSQTLLVLLKFALVFAMMGLPAIGFGATIPALLKTHKDLARESGQLLFVSSIANAAGFALMAFVLHRWLDYGPILVLLAAVSATALLVHAGPRRPVVWVGLGLLAAALVAKLGVWDESLMYRGHTTFHSVKRLEASRAESFRADSFKGAQDVFAIVYRDDNPFFFVNGYVSIPLADTSEVIVGALSAMMAPRTDEALVLGVGSGATAGTVGLLFDHTDGVEINKVVLDNLHRMTEYNFDIENMPGVSLHHDDGIHFVKTARKRYSLILNTVTSPLYFSSSKLYTTDFLESVASRLTPDGVYTTWVDYKIGDRGIDIILETLGETFESCWLTYLKSDYFLLTCSNGEMAMRHAREVAARPDLQERLAHRDALHGAMVPYSLLSTRALGLRTEGGTTVNSLDFPVLEHEMARLGRQTGLVDFRRRLLEAIDVEEIQSALEPALTWNPAEFVLWADLRLAAQGELREELARKVGSGLEGFEARYAEAAARRAGEIGTARAYYRYGQRMVQRDLFEGAIEALNRAVDADPKNHAAYYYLGRAHEGRGETEDARLAYARALKAKPNYSRAREALKRVSDAAEGPAGQGGN